MEVVLCCRKVSKGLIFRNFHKTSENLGKKYYESNFEALLSL